MQRHVPYHTQHVDHSSPYSPPAPHRHTAAIMVDYQRRYGLGTCSELADTDTSRHPENPNKACLEILSPLQWMVSHILRLCATPTILSPDHGLIYWGYSCTKLLPSTPLGHVSYSYSDQLAHSARQHRILPHRQWQFPRTGHAQAHTYWPPTGACS